MKRIVLLSGRLCTGKSLLARNLCEMFGFHHIKTSDIIRTKDRSALTRISLQCAGAQLDQATEDGWILEHIKDVFDEHKDDGSCSIVVDAVRTKDQIDRIREYFGLLAVHVHLEAPITILEERFDERKQNGRELEKSLQYSEADLITGTEEVNKLKADGDLCIDTSRSDEKDTLVRVASRLRLYSTPSHRCVDVIIGGQYGSEGKGQIAAYLSKNYQVLMRVGGPNAGHKARSVDGSVYTYHHLPSGSKDITAEILIGAGAVINPTRILEEINECGLEPGRIFIDPQAMTISDSDIQNEKALVDAIGSTGQGVGRATSRKILDRGNSHTTLARDIEPVNNSV